ncbi:MAG: hypothetical protein DAHOPDDO_00836 [Ignavibacteriaceae bacterium]|nr:hypothetical protein [Ignavibacteriaceae bacterium]
MILYQIADAILIGKDVKRNKWADYLISAIRYSSESNNRIIAYLKVHMDEGDTVGESRTWAKDELLQAMAQGKTFATIQKDSKGNWKKGEDISITASSEIFIRSDQRKIPGDFLENLPGF